MTIELLSDIENFYCKDLDTSTNTCNEPYKPDLAFERIKLQDISAIIELNQIGFNYLAENQLYIHKHNDAADSLSGLVQNVSKVQYLFVCSYIWSAAHLFV